MHSGTKILCELSDRFVYGLDYNVSGHTWVITLQPTELACDRE